MRDSVMERLITPTKSGSSRIPLFGTKKTYQPLQQDTKHQHPHHLPQSITDRDLGKLVRVAEKEGVLRFVGKVHFSAGTWCGIELRSPSGRNDGSVCGVRYFQCDQDHGLMVPASKVALVEEELSGFSGPFSILCALDATFIKTELLPKSDETFTIDGDEDEQTEVNKTVVLKRDEVIIDDANCTVTYKNSRKLERPFEFGAPLLNSTLTKLSHFSPFTTEDGSKRDSLEFEESLGILTPDQMMDTANFPSSRTPSSENVNLLAQRKSAEGLNSPSQMDSLGIIDEKVLADMELPLESVGKFKDFVMARVEQTPSPEELPLDSTPIVKTQPEKANNTFIVSISSITSLDTGYQGDGEMSRPASRGADNSPMTRRPLPRPQPRRNDPMTDSDFYTESDADNHEEHSHQTSSRGDRHARVIDGTLYGADPQAAADLYANNRENMDSSGVFTDIETSTRTDDVNKTLVPSPSGSSTKTISYDSQNLKTTPQHKTSTETILKRSPSSVISSPSSVRSPIHAPKEEPAPKKYKMPKRNVPSKVKAMIGAGAGSQQQKGAAALKLNKSVEKTEAGGAGKVSKKGAEEAKARLKDVKAKVFSGGGGRVGVEQKQKEARMAALRQNNGQKTAINKQRWPRPRLPSSTPPKAPRKHESPHSSLSDLSGASPAKISTGSAKKRDVVNVTQVLTAAKLSSSSSPNTPPQQTNNSAEVRKHRVSPKNDSKTPRKKPFTSPKPKEKTSKTQKVGGGGGGATGDKTECGRATVKGGRMSPSVRPQETQTRAPVKNSPSSDQRTVEALGVLIQHLVFNMEAFRVPTLKRQLEKAQQDAEQSRLMSARLAEALEERNKRVSALETNLTQLLDERSKRMAVLEEEKNHLHSRLAQLAEEHHTQMETLKRQGEDVEERLGAEQRALKECVEQLEATISENDLLKEENSKLLSFCNDPEKSIQEMHSLRAVLELKQSEFAELRRMFAEAVEKAEQVPALEEKVSTWKARCEDLELQLERKNLYEQQLLNEKKKLEESFKEECNHNRRLLQLKEELQWKLQKNKEVVNLVLEQAEENSSFNRSQLLSASFNERHFHSPKPHFERTHSFRERTSSSSSSNTCSLEGVGRLKTTTESEGSSPPSSPKVKGVVEKSDSVSYVLDLDENPAVVASRIVRRSFRNTTPPKNTPTKSPANKRARTKSGNTPTPTPKTDGEGEEEEENPFVFQRASSTPKAHACYNHVFEEEEDDLIDIPALPSEIGRRGDDAEAALSSVSLHLAGEMESNSEDESTSSSSVQL